MTLPAKWLMRSNDELHSQFNSRTWEFTNRTHFRGYTSPNPGHMRSSKSLFVFRADHLYNWRSENPAGEMSSPTVYGYSEGNNLLTVTGGS